MLKGLIDSFKDSIHRRNKSGQKDTVQDIDRDMDWMGCYDDKQQTVVATTELGHAIILHDSLSNRVLLDLISSAPVDASFAFSHRYRLVIMFFELFFAITPKQHSRDSTDSAFVSGSPTNKYGTCTTSSLASLKASNNVSSAPIRVSDKPFCSRLHQIEMVRTWAMPGLVSLHLEASILCTFLLSFLTSCFVSPGSNTLLCSH
jgi:hypothetical protein